MKITIQTIPHKQQRYDTAGDWLWRVNGDLEIWVSQLDDWKYNTAVAVHELIEVLLCKSNGISQEAVDEFDLNYQGEGEPGDCPEAPYHQEHCFATAVERLLIAAFNRAWKQYDDAVNAL